jgi:hypothetical protein
MKSIVKKVALALSAVTLTAAVSGAQVQVVGSVTGSPSLVNGLPSGTLEYFGSTINTFAVGSPVAVATLGGDPISNQNPTNLNNFGSFRLTTTNAFSDFTSPFTLTINFTQPQIGSSTASATITGTIGSLGGNLFVDFAGFSGSSNNLANYATVAGTNIRYFVSDLEIGAPQQDGVRNISITGAVAVVPEPSTYMLLGTGLGALGLVARRRRSNV